MVKRGLEVLQRNWRRSDMVYNSPPLFKRKDTYSLRGICMMMIIIHHLFQYTRHYYCIYYPNLFSFVLQSFGYLSTGVFFFLSGYGMYKSLERQGKVTAIYMFRHIKKLYVPFLFILLLAILYDSCMQGFDFASYFESFLLMSLLHYNDLWFLKVITVLYVFVMLVSLVTMTMRIRVAIVLGGVALYSIVAARFGLGTWWYNSILCFPLGMICASRCDKIQKIMGEINTRNVLIFFIVLFLIFYMLMYVFRNVLFASLSSLFFSMIAIILIAYFSPQSKFLQFVGVNSLIFYISNILLCQSYIFVPVVVLYVSLVIGGGVFISWLYSSISGIKLSSKINSN